MSETMPDTDSVTSETVKAPVEWAPELVRRRGHPVATGWIRAISTVDPGKAVRHVGTGHGRGTVVVAHEGIWVANYGSRTVARVDPRTLKLSAVQRFRKMPVALAAGPNAVWALGSNGWLWRIWPDGRDAEGVARIGRGATALAIANDLVWALCRSGRLTALDIARGEVARESHLPGGSRQMVTHLGELWASCRRGGRLVRVNPQSGQADVQLSLPQRARCLASGDGALVAGCARGLSRDRGWLHVIDTGAGQVASTFELPSQPRAVAVDGETAWVACGRGRDHKGTIERVDLATGEAATWRETDWSVSDLAVAEGTLFAAMSLIKGLPGVMHSGGEGFVGAGGGDGGGGGGGN